MAKIPRTKVYNPQKAEAYVGKGVLRNGDTLTAIKGHFSPVPNGPLIKKKGPFKGSTLKNGGSTVKAGGQTHKVFKKKLDKGIGNNLNGVMYEISKLSLVMQSEDSWLESIARKYKCSITFATDKILDFIIHLEAQGEESKTLQDAKSHYDNWFRIQKDLKLKTKNNGTNRKAGSPIPQDELLQAVAKAYGYTNTNT